MSCMPSHPVYAVLGITRRTLMHVRQALYQLNFIPCPIFFLHSFDLNQKEIWSFPMEGYRKSILQSRVKKKKTCIIFSLEEEGVLLSPAVCWHTPQAVLHECPAVCYSSLNTMPNAVSAHLVNALWMYNYGSFHPQYMLVDGAQSFKMCFIFNR